jgi:hypothetical protein
MKLWPLFIVAMLLLAAMAFLFGMASPEYTEKLRERDYVLAATLFSKDGAERIRATAERRYASIGQGAVDLAKDTYTADEATWERDVGKRNAAKASRASAGVGERFDSVGAAIYTIHFRLALAASLLAGALVFLVPLCLDAVFARQLAINQGEHSKPVFVHHAIATLLLMVLGGLCYLFTPVPLRSAVFFLWIALFSGVLWLGIRNVPAQ